MNKDFYPKLDANTIIYKHNDDFLFLEPEKPNWIVVNANMAKLLALCDGTRSISDIESLLQGVDGSDNAIFELNRIFDAGFFDNNTNIKQNNVANLYSVHLNMTSKCNLKCIYCYAEQRDNRTQHCLSLEEYKNLIDEIQKISNNATITFTGGEPLLNKSTIELAEHCKYKGFNTYLLTNGTLINSDNAKKVAKAFDTIRISIDGASKTTHEIHRGFDSYSRAIHGIQLLEKHGNAPNIAMTVTRKNIIEIENMSKIYGNRLTYQPIYNVGRAREHNIGISGKEYYEALAAIKTVEPYGHLIAHLQSLRNRGCTKCAVGDGEISISPTGDVFPCHMLHDKPLLCGNIRNNSFETIYHNSKTLNAIRKLSVNTKQKCKDCHIRLLCGGGCWARAYYANRTLNSSDCFCDYEFLAFKNGILNCGLPKQ